MYISPDLTPKEQEINKKLWTELKKLNKDGNQYQIKTAEYCSGRAINNSPAALKLQCTPPPLITK